MLDELSQSFVDDGRFDFRLGIPKNLNPHPKDTAPYYLWERGWDQEKHYAKTRYVLRRPPPITLADS